MRKKFKIIMTIIGCAAESPLQIASGPLLGMTKDKDFLFEKKITIRGCKSIQILAKMYMDQNKRVVDFIRLNPDWPYQIIPDDLKSKLMSAFLEEVQ